MGRKPTIVFDIDGVIATGSREEVYSNEAGWAYEKCVPIPSTITVIQEIYRRTTDIKGIRSLRVILFTSRWAKDQEKTEKWLKYHGVPYDELIMGKPPADLYIDDRNFPVRFEPGEYGADKLLSELEDSLNGDYADWMFDNESQDS
jgi:hypothetical protein